MLWSTYTSHNAGAIGSSRFPDIWTDEPWDEILTQRWYFGDKEYNWYETVYTGSACRYVDVDPSTERVVNQMPTLPSHCLCKLCWTMSTRVPSQSLLLLRSFPQGFQLKHDVSPWKEIGERKCQVNSACGNFSLGLKISTGQKIEGVWV